MFQRRKVPPPRILLNFIEKLCACKYVNGGIGYFRRKLEKLHKVDQIKYTLRDFFPFSP